MTATTAAQGAAAPISGASRRPAKRQQSFAERLVRKRGPGLIAFAVFIGLWQLLSEEHPERAELGEPIPANAGGQPPVSAVERNDMSAGL